jgi:glycine/D-amino acid oxidase-like deaminating enzyme
VVNAGGTYARQIGEWSGLHLPMTSMTHHYLVTDTVPEFRDLEKELPVIRDDKKVSGYIRMEQKSGLIGIYEKANPNAVWARSLPLGSRERAVRGRLRPHHALARERHGADADLRRTRASSARCMARFPIRRTAIR